MKNDRYCNGMMVWMDLPCKDGPGSRRDGFWDSFLPCRSLSVAVWGCRRRPVWLPGQWWYGNQECFIGRRFAKDGYLDSLWHGRTEQSEGFPILFSYCKMVILQERYRRLIVVQVREELILVRRQCTIMSCPHQDDRESRLEASKRYEQPAAALHCSSNSNPNQSRY